MSSKKPIDVNLPHHQQNEFCTTRAVYRQGRNLTAVKVFTISKESQHLLIYNVPSIGLHSELLKLCQRFGNIKIFSNISKDIEQPSEIEEFTNVYHVSFTKFKGARFAKKHLDNRSFFGGLLHVCYAPELETVDETREKLIQRRKDVSIRTKSGEEKVIQANYANHDVRGNHFSGYNSGIQTEKNPVVTPSANPAQPKKAFEFQEVPKLVSAGVLGTMFIPKLAPPATCSKTVTGTKRGMPKSSDPHPEPIVKQIKPSTRPTSRIIFHKK